LKVKFQTFGLQFFNSRDDLVGALGAPARWRMQDERAVAVVHTNIAPFVQIHRSFNDRGFRHIGLQLWVNDKDPVRQRRHPADVFNLRIF